MAQSNAATSPAAAAKRIDRRPSNLMMEDLNQNDLSVRADSAPQVASPAQVQPEMNQPIEHNNYAYNVSMSASTNEALVRKATAALEPLCGRLCRYAGQPGFDIAVDRAELEKIRNLYAADAYSVALNARPSLAPCPADSSLLLRPAGVTRCCGSPLLTTTSWMRCHPRCMWAPRCALTLR